MNSNGITDALVGGWSSPPYFRAQGQDIPKDGIVPRSYGSYRGEVKIFVCLFSPLGGPDGRFPPQNIVGRDEDFQCWTRVHEPGTPNPNLTAGKRSVRVVSESTKRVGTLARAPERSHAPPQ